MITHTWTVEKLECSPLMAGFENVVRKVFWLLTSTDGTKVAASSGYTDLSFMPDHSSFVNFNTLDEKTVFGWVVAELGQEYLTGYEQAHERMIISKPLPEIVEIPLPWAPVVIDDSVDAGAIVDTSGLDDVDAGAIVNTDTTGGN